MHWKTRQLEICTTRLLVSGVIFALFILSMGICFLHFPLVFPLSVSVIWYTNCIYIVAAPVKKTENTTGGVRCADHATPSIRKNWYYFAKKRRSLGRHSSLADQSHGVYYYYYYYYYY
jgi:hypothetical protein